MKAPEKLYVELCSDGVYAHIGEWKNSDNIEYIRTDAFIEKACKYLEPIIFSMNSGDRTDTDKFIEDFINYMKGK